MGSLSESTPNIPIVDFSRWHTNSDKQAVAHELVEACRNVGFVYIINHGLAQQSLDDAFATAKRLFELSHEEKMQAPHPPGPEVHRGYSYPGLEKVSQHLGGKDDDADVAEKLREVTDCKESYEIGSEDNCDQSNVWLPESTLPGFRAFTTDFYWECFAVAKEILRAIALGIGLKYEDFFLQYHSGLNGQLRLLHYPSLPAADVEGGSVERMPAHSDWSTITMLFQDDCGGLEVEDPHEKGKFIEATPIPGACVVNVGDLLMRWSNGKSCG
jgi:isopenicillin N synthase-like dioxygenase